MASFINNILIFAIGVACILLAVKQWIFFLQKGGLTWDPRRVSARAPYLPKVNATSDERFQLFLQACTWSVVGLAFSILAILNLLHLPLK